MEKTLLPESEHDLLTMEEVARVLRINRSSVARLLRGGNLSYIQIGGRKLVGYADLRLFIDKRKVKNDESADRNGA